MSGIGGTVFQRLRLQWLGESRLRLRLRLQPLQVLSITITTMITLTMRKPIAITITASSEVVDDDYDYSDHKKADYDCDYDYSLFRSCRLWLWLQISELMSLLMAISITTQKRGEELRYRPGVSLFWAIVSVTRGKYNKIDKNGQLFMLLGI